MALPSFLTYQPLAVSSSFLTYQPRLSSKPAPRRLFISATTSTFTYRRASLRLRATGPLPAMATGQVEILPPVLDSTSEPPTLFDGTTRLYISYICPYPQRTWIARNYKGLQDSIKLVPIDLGNRPAWYKEKVYAENKVPSLEHNNVVKGESLDLLKYIDEQFEGPKLLPEDPAKREFAEELFAYFDTFNSTIIKSLSSEEDIAIKIGESLDYLESALSKFDDGPFFLGQFSNVDITYAPFIERYGPVVLELKQYDITSGRPKLAAWIEELDKIDAYKQTKGDPKVFIGIYKQRFGVK